MVKIMHICIPDSVSLPDSIQHFSPEENAEMLKIGMEAICNGRKFIANLTQEEIHKKIEEEKKQEIENLNRELQIEKSIFSRQLEERDRLVEKEIEKANKRCKLYEDEWKKENQILKDAMTNLREQLRFNEAERDNLTRQKISEKMLQEREKFELLLLEKDKRLDQMRETIDKCVVSCNDMKVSYNDINNKKTLVGLGKQGENSCYELLDSSFKDFDGFELIDKHNEGKQGDFHLKFKIFDVLVDAKNYSNKVPTKETNKIKRDLKMNDHLHFAWMISLNTKITSFDKSPIMFEWIEDNKCICYINELMKYENPSEILRQCWFSCKELHKICIKEDDDTTDNELAILKESQLKMREKIVKIKKKVKEMRSMVSNISTIGDQLEDELKDLLNEETNNILEDKYKILAKWWNENIEDAEKASSLQSTEIWNKCKNDLELNDMKPQNFRDFLRGFLPSDTIIKKNKNENSALEITNIRWIEGEKAEKKEKPILGSLKLNTQKNSLIKSNY